MIEICVYKLERRPDYIKFLYDGHFKSNIILTSLKCSDLYVHTR